MKLLYAVEFQDWDIKNKKTIFKTFPKGTEVKDVARPSNNSPTRLFKVVGVDGFIADLHKSQVSK